MSRLSAQQRSVWADHIQSQRDSGITQEAYCQKHDLKPHQYWYWKRKLAGSRVTKTAQPVKQNGFVQVSVARSTPIQHLRITLPNGITVDGITDHNQHLAQQLIGALK